MKTAVAKIKKLTRLRPTLAMVLGSGFQHALEEFEIEAALSCREIAGFPKTRVRGHAGELMVGHFGTTAVLILSGRAHFYEGDSFSEITFPIRVLAALGIRDLLLTNAAGGINRTFRRGDFMAVSDHINFMGANPLRGKEVSGMNRFVDLTDAYDVGLRRILQRAAGSVNVKLRSGIYLAVSGPSYETPAEIRAFAKLGADAVGMSTVPEVIVARQCGLRVAAVSCITNPAAGRNREKISHAEVLETGERVKRPAARLLAAFAEQYGKEFLEKTRSGRKLQG